MRGPCSAMNGRGRLGVGQAPEPPDELDDDIEIVGERQALMCEEHEQVDDGSQWNREGQMSTEQRHHPRGGRGTESWSGEDSPEVESPVQVSREVQQRP